MLISKPPLPDEYLVDNRVYTDEVTYRAEIERLFFRVWNFVCHESEIANPGDFITTEVAGQPLIITRDKQGCLRAFYNTCRHRGAMVVTEPKGHVRAFTCMYHLWAYELDGSIRSVPEIEAYNTSFNPGGLDKKAFGLIPVKIDSIHRMVFVAFSDDVPPLPEFLGEVANVFKLPFGLPEMQVQVEGRKPFPANWKMQPENSRDGYHAPLLHKRLRFVSPPGPYYLFKHGHAVQYLGLDYASGLQHETVDHTLTEHPELADKFMTCPFPGVDEKNRVYVITLFPDSLILVRYSALFVLRQVFHGPGETITEVRSGHLTTDSPDVQEIRRKHWYVNWSEDEGNPPEDRMAWELQQRGMQSAGMRYSILARGEKAETGVRGDDNRIRHFWSEWRRMMGVGFNGPVDTNA